jgi:cyclopropane fatty-acyl-phospholipid synthase-like methyltransferase
MTADFTVPADWYRSFFTGPVNRFWENVTPEAATRADVAFVRRHLGAEPPAAILDLPCGAGRHSLGLARFGYQVTGIDISQEAVARASVQAQAEGIPADFRHADMRELDESDRFDAAICFGNSIGYFPPEETEAFFGRVARALKPGGLLILDSSCCAESILPLQERRDLAFEGGSYRSELAYDATASVLKTRAELRLGEEVHYLRYAHQIVTSGELVRMLRAAGLRTRALYGGVEDEPYRPGCPRLLLVANRG